MDFILPFLARWTHIVSGMIVLGGMLFAALALLPALKGSPTAQSTSDAIAARFRPWFLLGVLGLLVSGFYNYYRHVVAKDVPSMYHMIFGMKFLLALHVFAVGYLALGHNKPKRARLIGGVVISGLVVVVLSNWMRVLSLEALMHPISK